LWHSVGRLTPLSLAGNNPQMPPFTTRRGTVADVDLLATLVQAGFDSSREFAPDK
jgi:hypothetical protein